MYFGQYIENLGLVSALCLLVHRKYKICLFLFLKIGLLQLKSALF